MHIPNSQKAVLRLRLYKYKWQRNSGAVHDYTFPFPIRNITVTEPHGERFGNRERIEIFLLPHSSKPSWGPFSLLFNGYEVLSSEVKRLGCDVDHLHRSRTEVNVWKYTSSHPYVLMISCRIKHGNSFTFTHHRLRNNVTSHVLSIT